MVVYQMTSVGAWTRDFGLRDQVRRAAVSVASNIAEGFARETNIEFCRFLAIARGSACEAKTQMYIALDLGYLEQSHFDDVYRQIDCICRMLTGLMQYLRRESKQPSTGNRQQSTKELQ